MNKIVCQCGRTLSATTLDGQPRKQCPVCKRPVPPPGRRLVAAPDPDRIYVLAALDAKRIRAACATVE
jgi:hypothetical protein